MRLDIKNADCHILFKMLMETGCIAEHDVVQTADGFYAIRKSLSSILAEKGILTLTGKDGQEILCRHYLDDWYFYSAPGANGPCCSLFKMREQEHELEEGLKADGDTPGVTISFITFQTHLFEACLQDPAEETRKKLWQEVNRVVANPGQRHDPDLKAYFIRPEAQGAYLIAELYVDFIRALASDGMIPVPVAYRELWKDRKKNARAARIPDFIDANNNSAGQMICDHEKICLKGSGPLSLQEKLAILATHTGNCSFHSFAAEVRFHTQFLVWYAKVSIPFVGSSPYASAIRADMTISDKEFEGPAPYYDPESALMKEQMQNHLLFEL